MAALRTIILFAVICLFIFTAISFAFAEYSQSNLSVNETKEQLSSSPLISSLEAPIDPDEYIMGPGDKIVINIWGTVQQSFPAAVSPIGILSIPTIGDIEITGVTFTEACEMIKTFASSVYKKDKVTINLVELRIFRIPVTGMVMSPGVYPATHADRVSRLIDLAGGLILDTSSLRNIKLVSRSGDTLNLDMLKFRRKASLEENPFVNEGDIIYVPAVSKGVGIITVSGSIRLPDAYEYNANDKIGTMIDLSGGLTENALIAEIEVIRCLDNKREYKSYILDLKNEPEAWEFPLKPDDRIFIRRMPKYHERHNVIVEGEVEYPGQYAIIEEKTKLSDLIKEAGGFTDEASLADAEIIRVSIDEVFDPEFERLKTIPVADMTDMEYEYFKTKSREKSVVVVDFPALFEKDDKSQDVYIRNGDLISIPKKLKTVKVSGQVVHPGLFDFEAGKDYRYYVELAGGYNFNAQRGKIRVIRAATGKWIKPNSETQIYIGDTIFIPEKPEKDYWELYKDILIVLGQTATLIFIVTTLSK